MQQILLAYDLPKETVTAIMMLYKNKRALVCLPDGDTDFFDIIAGVLCDNTPLADPHYLNQPNYSWPLESSSGFSHLWPDILHAFANTPNTQPRGWKKKKNKQLSPSAKKEEICNTSVHSVD